MKSLNYYAWTADALWLKVNKVACYLKDLHLALNIYPSSIIAIILIYMHGITLPLNVCLLPRKLSERRLRSHGVLVIYLFFQYCRYIFILYSIERTCFGLKCKLFMQVSMIKTISFGPRKAKMCLRTCVECTESDHPAHAQSITSAIFSPFIHSIVSNDSVSGQ